MFRIPNRFRRRRAQHGASSAVHPEYYLRQYEDVTKAGAGAAAHFYNHGAIEGRIPHPSFSSAYVYNTAGSQSWAEVYAQKVYAKLELYNKPRLIFVSHDATRTGAPAIILRLLEMFSTTGDFECFSILDEGGERLDEFKALSHTHVMSQSRRNPKFSDADAQAEIRNLFGGAMFARNAPVVALVNSAESRRIGRDLHQLGIPVISLIHEVSAYYPPEHFEEFAAFSRKIIFPSKFVQKVALELTSIDPDKCLVRGQGLLEDSFGELDRANCRRQLRAELELDEAAFIILNVGTQDVRKGIDIFALSAVHYLNENPGDSSTHFIWYGQWPDHDPDGCVYATDLIEQFGYKSRIRILPSTTEIERIFKGADLFLLTARADPFPCVIHEALACGLPVIALQGGGGAPELVGEDCGTIVEMANPAAVVRAITDYRHDPKKCQNQSQNAVTKIRNDWQFQDYFLDLWKIMSQHSNMPAAPLPSALPDLPGHLVIMLGSSADLQVLGTLAREAGPGVTHTALIGGRFEPEIDGIMSGLSRIGGLVRVHQPSDDTDSDRARLVARSLLKPRPRKVTLIDVVRFLDAGQLKLLNFPKRLVVANEQIGIDALLEIADDFEDILFADAILARMFKQARPDLSDRVRHLRL